MPTQTIEIGDRVYEIFPVLKPGEEPISRDDAITRGREFGANMGQEDGEHIQNRGYSDDIPKYLRGKVALYFPEWITDFEMGGVKHKHMARVEWGRHPYMSTESWTQTVASLEYPPATRATGEDHFVRRIR